MYQFLKMWSSTNNFLQIHIPKAPAKLSEVLIREGSNEFEQILCLEQNKNQKNKTRLALKM